MSASATSTSTHHLFLASPSEERYADELKYLKTLDQAPKPPGWSLSPSLVKKSPTPETYEHPVRKTQAKAKQGSRRLIRTSS